MYRLTNIESNGREYIFSHKKKTTEESERGLYFFIVWKGRRARSTNLEKKFSLNYFAPEDAKNSTYRIRYSKLENFFKNPYKDKTNSMQEKIAQVLDSTFWNLSLNFERDAPDTVFNSLKATYYKSSYIKSKQIYPAYLYTATINNNKTGGSGGIKILYPYRKEIWTPTGQDVSKARRLPKKSTRILIKPFYGKIEMNSVGQVRGDKSMRRQVGQTETPYDKHKHIRAIGYWGKIALEIAIKRSGTSVWISAGLIALN